MRPHCLRSAAILVALALAASLSGCTTKAQLALCPTASSLIEASSLTRFAPGAFTDPAHRLFRVDLMSVSTTCDINEKERTVTSGVKLQFRAIRNPSRLAADATVPYFVAIHSGADISAKEIFQVHFHFDPGQTTANFDDEVDAAVIHVPRDKQTYDYQLLAGLQLSEAELAYNRAEGLYGP